MLKWDVFVYIKHKMRERYIMPIYEYKCGACGHQFESIQKMTDQPLTDCPVCHQNHLQKLVSAAGFQLKGTGWYATDFKNKGKPETKTTEKTEKTDVKSDKGSDSNSSSTDTAAK